MAARSLCSAPRAPRRARLLVPGQGSSPKATSCCSADSASLCFPAFPGLLTPKRCVHRARSCSPEQQSLAWGQTPGQKTGATTQQRGYPPGPALCPHPSC